MVRYYGWYSNRGRGEREQREPVAAASHPEKPSEVEVLGVSDCRSRKIPSPQWREGIKKRWEVDPLSCPKCGCEVKISSFIAEAGGVRKILEPLNLWEENTPEKRHLQPKPTKDETSP